MTFATASSRPRRPRWRRRLTLAFRGLNRFLRRRSVMSAIEFATLLLTAAMVALAWHAFAVGSGAPKGALSPWKVAALLVGNLVPAMALIVLGARRLAQRRTRHSAIGGRGRLHVRLVAMFSVIAAVPTLLVVIFASLLFQISVEFWFSDKIRTVLTSADHVAQTYVNDTQARNMRDILPMAADLARVLREAPIDDPRVGPFFARQVQFRSFDQAEIINVAKDGTPHMLGGANLDNRPLAAKLPASLIPQLADGQPRSTTAAGDRVESVILLDADARTYLYVSRFIDPLALTQAQHSSQTLNAYQALVNRSRSLQLQFNLALFFVSLLIVGIAVWIALEVADRMVRPVGELVLAARRVASGDFTARATTAVTPDEIGTLAGAFNRMTRRIEDQTGALVAANGQLENRRALIEAVLSGVSAGVVSIDRDRRITLVNSSAAMILREGEALIGRTLHDVAPALDGAVDRADRDSVVRFALGDETRTLAVKLVRVEAGHVLTFDDITEQLADQRRAAWADVARRIAHEIKNPLTPIQLAAERLQRRYGREIQSDPATFERLTQTIVRQVGDLRSMVDEFSAFARMPKPEFRPEAIGALAREVLFLHEVAYPAILFRIDVPEPSPILVCDRRQLGQALTNIVKNAVEAIEGRGGEGAAGAIQLSLRQDGDRLSIEVADDGIGLPPERERLTEPYMTTRARGTGLGLAIVKKIVEDHQATIAFADRAGGGAIVRLCFDVAALAPLALDAVAEAHGFPEGDDGRRLPELTRVRIG